jgi:hypothetical protein
VCDDDRHDGPKCGFHGLAVRDNQAGASGSVFALRGSLDISRRLSPDMGGVPPRCAYGAGA